MTHPLCLFFALLLFGAVLTKNQCTCRPALEQDWAHGANESVEIRGVTVKRIKGRVLDPHGGPIGDAIVEVFDYLSADEKQSGYQVAESKKRRAACLADADGQFCFSDLPGGKYVLKVGTRKPDGTNNTYMIVNLSRHCWRKSRNVEIRLNLGT